MLPMVRKSWFADSWSTLVPLQCIQGFAPPQNPCIRLNNTKNIQNCTKFAALGDPVPTVMSQYEPPIPIQHIWVKTKPGCSVWGKNKAP